MALLGATLNWPVDVPDPLAVPLAKIVTVAPASAMPLKVGVLIFVTLSLLLGPVSEAVTRSGVVGAGGAFVSIVTFKPTEAFEKFALATLLEEATSRVMLCAAVVSV